MRKIPSLLLAAGFLASCTSQIELPGSVLPPEPDYAAHDLGPPVGWRAVDATTGQISDIAELETLAMDHPDSSSVRLRLLNAHFAAEDLDGVYQQVLWLTQRDYQFSENAEAQIASLYEGARAEQLASAFASDLPPLSNSTVVAAIGTSARLVEAVLYDPSTDRLFATEVVSRTLIVRDGDEPWRETALAGVGSLSGIALDGQRGIVWVGSGTFDQTPDPDSAFRGVIGIDRDTLEVRHRIPAPAGATISDIAVGPDGAVYGSDPLGGGLYVAEPGASAMRALIAPGTFRSPQGIAVRPDGRSLFVSDYRYGLAVVTLGRTPHAYRVQSAVPVLLDGIDGLWLRANELIAVQNGVSPARIVAFELGEGVGNITGYRTLERANPAWTEPLGGAISGDSLYYVGNGSWDLFGEGGALNEGADLRVTQVRMLPLVESPPPHP